MSAFYIKTNRIFNPIRKWSWLFILVVAFAGLWYPKLGLLMIPIMIALPVLGLMKGKYWCGNICPHGSLFDKFIQPISANRKIPSWAKSKITMAIALTWFMYMLVRRLINVFAMWGTVSFTNKLGYIFVMNYFVVTVVGTTLALFINSRTWCNFCPMATFQLIFYKLGQLLRVNKTTDEKVSVARTEMCHRCGTCARVCPMQISPYLEFSDNNQVENDLCIRCSTCVANCPAGILSLENQENAINIKRVSDIKGYEDIQTIKAKISAIRPLAKDVKEFTFKILDPIELNYQPGQFLLVKIQDDPEMFRAFSISSYYKEKNELRVTVKRVPGGYGTTIIFKDFNVGYEVVLKGPMGRDLVVDKDAEKIALVAGGIGITPFVPIVKDLLENANNVKRVLLIYGVNKVNDFLYDDYFKKLEREYHKFHYIKIVAFDEKWQGRKGFVTEALKELDLEGYKVYMCGPNPMIKPALQVLTERGIPDDEIFCECA